MPRHPRLELPDATYYVMNRASSGNAFFRSERDLQAFKKFLVKIEEHWSIEVIAYCLLPNQYHLLLHTEEANLSKALHQLNASYAYYLIKSGQFSGSVFSKRYKSTLIEARIYQSAVETYLDQLLRPRSDGEIAGIFWCREKLAADASTLAAVQSIFEKSRWPKVLGTLPFKNQIPQRMAEGSLHQPSRFSEEGLIPVLEELTGTHWTDIRFPKNREHREARRISMLAFRKFLHWDYRRLSEQFNVRNIANISRIVNQKDVGIAESELWREVEKTIRSKFPVPGQEGVEHVEKIAV